MSARRGSWGSAPRALLALTLLLFGLVAVGHADPADAAGRRQTHVVAWSDLSAHPVAPRSDDQSGHDRLGAVLDREPQLGATTRSTAPAPQPHTAAAPTHASRSPRAPPA